MSGNGKTVPKVYLDVDFKEKRRYFIQTNTDVLVE